MMLVSIVARSGFSREWREKPITRRDACLGDGMNKSHVRAVLVVSLCALGLPLVLAFEHGADAGLSGGPAGYQFGAGNCTACHSFNAGPGGVELVGAPRRYRAGTLYDLTVRVFDIDQLAGGFEISAEGGGGHIGVFELTDAVFTQNAAGVDPINYVTHTRDGYNDSLANWNANGGAYYEYRLAWRAPAADAGPATFFVAGNAVNHNSAPDGDRFYATHATTHYAKPGDGDGDTDLDLSDFAVLQRCFSDSQPAVSKNCAFVDFDADEFVALNDVTDFAAMITGPATSLPAAFVLADPVRGGRLYDNWWVTSGVAEPVGDHALWAYRPDKVSNVRSGPVTWRCKECHGWDYVGVDGAYGNNDNHRTGFGGVLGTALTPRALFDLLKADDPATGGHDMDAAGLTDSDLWDVVKMTLDATIDTSQYIDGDGTFNGDPDFGLGDYFTACWSCHGDLGADVPGVNIFVEAAVNPWEFLHKARFSQPGTPMPSLHLLNWSLQRTTNIGAYAAILAP